VHELKTWKSIFGGAVVAAALVSAAHAEIVDQRATGFSLQEKEQIAATPDKVYAALIDVSKWWDSAHSFSGDAKNMTLDARAGGCWCESLPKSGGSVLHMTVVYADPGKVLRLRGALGPFQSTGMDGAMNFVLTPNKQGTEIQLVYNLGGYIWGDFQAIPKSADGVLGLQLFRLKQFIETGSAATPRPAEEKKP
jgi:uncharacterized protein YndB with AHSA1/START domain